MADHAPRRPAIRIWRPNYRAWRCEHCGQRFLAWIIDGERFETPGGVKGYLPASLPCAYCHQHSVRGAVLDGGVGRAYDCEHTTTE